MFKKSALAAVIAVGLFSSAAFAGSPSPKWELKRMGMGPRPDQYTWVRVYPDSRSIRPYALTGDVPRSADSSRPKWELKRMNGGPRPDQYVWVRVDR